jgi:hypothetical protein
VIRGVEVDAGGVAERETVGEEGGGDAFVRHTIGAVAHGGDAEMHFLRMRLETGGDGIEARLKLAQIFDEGSEREAGFGCFAEEVANFVVLQERIAQGCGAAIRQCDLSVGSKA